MNGVDTKSSCYLRRDMCTNGYPAKPECHMLWISPFGINGCLASEVANITHKACYSIDTAKELQK